MLQRWCYCCCLLMLTVACVVRGEDEEAKEDGEGRGVGRSMRDDFGVDEWRGVPQHQIETSGWVASDDSSSTDRVLPKRRRLRKRKRRPPVDGEPDQGPLQPRPRRRRPVRLDVHDTWKEMEAETPKRAYNRRRLSPVYGDGQSSTDGYSRAEPLVVYAAESTTNMMDETPSTTRRSEKVNSRRRNNVRLDSRNGEAKPTTTIAPPTSIRSIKELIKQNSGLSLSEILQKQNLSLSDLLKGKQQAISALSEKPPPSTKITLPVEQTTINDELVTKDAQRKRLGQIYKNSANTLFSDVTKYDVVTEEATEKRIFVPSHPKFYTSVNYRSEFNGYTEPSTVSTTTTSKPVISSNKVVKKKLPVTSAKINQNIKSPVKIPIKAIPISISDILGLIPKEATTTEVDNTNGPFKMLFDLEELVRHNTIEPVATTAAAPVTTQASPPEKMKVATAKDEIMEILNDRQAKERLHKILTSRNMTVDELVQMRERGSSQHHLADMFHNKMREPEPTEEHVVAVKVAPSRKPKIKSLPDVSLSDEIVSTEHIRGTSFPTYKIETNKQPPVHIPIWKTIYPGLYNTQAAPKNVLEDEIENTLAQAVNNEHTTSDYDDYISLPIGVKSAIFASLAIVGISLFIFLTILVIFKWSQWHKKKLCYGSRFSCSKIKSPILQQAQPRRSLRSFVSETLGKKKSFYAASRLQSMSDISWESTKQYQ